MNRTPAEQFQSATTQASNVHTEFANEVPRGISVAWKKVLFQLGGRGTSNPGVLLTPDDDLVFAGEHPSILQGRQEGAILSAYQAIDQVVARDSV